MAHRSATFLKHAPNKALQPAYLPSLRYGKSAAELGR